MVQLEANLSLIAVVGRGMKNGIGIASRVFSALAESGISIKMLDQGSSELSIIIGIDDKYFEDAIRAIYKKFFTD